MNKRAAYFNLVLPTYSMLISRNTCGIYPTIAPGYTYLESFGILTFVLDLSFHNNSLALLKAC